MFRLVFVVRPLLLLWQRSGFMYAQLGSRDYTPRQDMLKAICLHSHISYSDSLRVKFISAVDIYRSIEASSIEDTASLGRSSHDKGSLFNGSPLLKIRLWDCAQLAKPGVAEQLRQRHLQSASSTPSQVYSDVLDGFHVKYLRTLQSIFDDVQSDHRYFSGHYDIPLALSTDGPPLLQSSRQYST